MTEKQMTIIQQAQVSHVEQAHSPVERTRIQEMQAEVDSLKQQVNNIRHELKQVHDLNFELLSALRHENETRKKSEHALHDVETIGSREYFELMFNTNPDAALVTRLLDGIIVNVNDGFTRMYGYSREESIGVSTLALGLFTNPDDRSRIAAILREQGQSEEQEVIFRRKDQSLLIGLVTARVIEIAGDLLTFVSIHDITERSRKQELLRQSEERFELLFDKAPLGYQSLDQDGCFLEVNQQWLDMLGYERQEVIGHWFGDFLDPIYQNAFRARFPIFKQQGHIHSEFEMLGKQGNRLMIAFEGRIAYEPDHSFKQTHCILQDITDRLKTEAALAESEEKHRRLFETMIQGVVYQSADGTIISANPAAERILGVTFDQMLGRTSMDPGWQSIREDGSTLPGADHPAMVALRTGKQVGPVIMGVYQPQIQGNIWLSVNAIPLFRPGESTPYQVYATLEDITQQKQREDEIIYLNTHDVLTGLYNRAHFDAETKRLDQADQLPLTVVIGDINGLKLINDAFGHAEGDKILYETARVLKKCCRNEDILARVGGDEFCILLPQTDSETANAILRRIQDACEKHERNAQRGVHFLSISLGFGTKERIDEAFSDVFRTAEDFMYRRKLLENRSLHSSILSSIKATMHEKSDETREHGERLAELSRSIGVRLNLDESKLQDLALLANLHDIGKIIIDDQILAKQGKLTEQEWLIMKKHPEVGYRIAHASPDIRHIAEGILCHHERWDGTGYPQGLAGTAIPLEARIMAVVDAYDAMTHDRAYRKALTVNEAVSEIRANAGRQFDPVIARMFTERITSTTP